MNQHTFTNGFRCIYQKGTVPLSAIYVFVKYGSIHEGKGFAHFIEHMCFKGTRKIPESKAIVSNYDNIGAYINANTHKEYTVYIVKCNVEYTAHCIDILSDMMLNSVFKPSHIRLEQNVVIEECVRLNDDAEYYIETIRDRMLYQDTSYAEPVDSLDYHKTLFDTKTVQRSYREQYQPNNMGISIVSPIAFSTIKKMIERSGFSQKPTLSPTSSLTSPLTYSCVTNKPQFNIMTKKGSAATHLSISFRTCPQNHPDTYPLHLLTRILGGYMSSRMFMTLREKHGITYKSTCSLKSYWTMGHIELYAICDPDNLMHKQGVLPLLIRMLRDLRKNGITREELESAKGNINGAYIMNMEQIQIPCLYNGIESILYDKPEVVPYDQLYSTHYANLTKKSVDAVILKYMEPANMVVSIVGEDVPSQSSIELLFRA